MTPHASKHPADALAKATLLCLALVLFTALAGCGPKPPVAQRTPEPQAGHPAVDTRAQAEQAFERGDHARSEVLNRRLLDQDGLSEAQRAEAWKRLAKSAVENGHPQVALEALQNLARLRPAAADTWEYNRVYVAALLAAGRPDSARSYLSTLLRDDDRPWDLRFRAGLSLARDLWGEHRYEDALRTLERLYADSPDPSPMSRGQLEAGLLAELTTMDEATLIELVRATPAESQWRFPYTIVRLEQARRLGLVPDHWPRAWRILTGLTRYGDIADKTLVEDVLGPLRRRHGVPTGGIALALPLSGPYAEIGWKVMRGAGAAQWEILSAGGQMNIRAVNTEAPGWLEDIENLPSGLALMGGPLRLDRFRDIERRGLLERRPAFAFLPRLEGAVEGLDAWRFFSSPEDQVRALLDLSAGQLGVSDYAVFSPRESFGERYAAAFRQETDVWEASVNATGTYPPGEPTKWGREVAALVEADLDTPEEERLPPEPPFQAVFLPDGWSQAKLIAPQFFFYDEDRLLLLGPALWGQGLARDDNVEVQYFRLAVFPGAWWAENPAPGTQALRRTMQADGLGEPDFWVALGYDFVRLAAALPPLPAEWTATSVNGALAAAEDVQWSMAPMSWGDTGQARQEMFLFQPASDGFAALDAERLARRLERVRARHEDRVEALIAKRELEALRKLQEENPDNEAINTKLQLLLDRLEQEKLDEQ